MSDAASLETKAPFLDRLLAVRGGWRLRDNLLQSSLIAPRRPRAYWFKGVSNFGDALGPTLLRFVLGAEPIWVTRHYKGKVLAVGSILQTALAASDIVWGSGLIRDQTIRPPPRVKFLAVRGPLTRSRILADVPPVYGDPAVLLPRFHRTPVEQTHAIGIVPHYHDKDATSIESSGVSIVDVGRPWRLVVDAIRSCERVISSSLHGIIVAEAYGIPASWVQITDRPKGGTFKFHDYLLATGRDPVEPIPFRLGIERAVNRQLPAPQFDLAPLLEATLGLPEFIRPPLSTRQP